ncbi:MAG: YkgJ family cysteine cluster protein [Promethearchaeota archaeon]
MNFKCKNCDGRCCLDTEMLLSKKDINLILKNSAIELKKEYFVSKQGNYFKLKNYEHHCVFFNIKSKTCKIYNHRPQGCRFYPLIYDKDKGSCLLDSECPRTHLFYQSSKEYKQTCKKIIFFLKEHLNIDL